MKYFIVICLLASFLYPGNQISYRLQYACDKTQFQYELFHKLLSKKSKNAIEKKALYHTMQCAAQLQPWWQRLLGIYIWKTYEPFEIIKKCNELLDEHDFAVVKAWQTTANIEIIRKTIFDKHNWHMPYEIMMKNIIYKHTHDQFEYHYRIYGIKYDILLAKNIDPSIKLFYDWQYKIIQDSLKKEPKKDDALDLSNFSALEMYATHSKRYTKQKNIAAIMYHRYYYLDHKAKLYNLYNESERNKITRLRKENNIDHNPVTNQFVKIFDKITN